MGRGAARPKLGKSSKQVFCQQKTVQLIIYETKNRESEGMLRIVIGKQGVIEERVVLCSKPFPETQKGKKNF